MNALWESMEKLMLHQKRLMKILLDPKRIERETWYMVSSFRRMTSRLQGRRLEFSPVGVPNANVPIFGMTPTSPIYSVDDGLSGTKLC